MTGLSLAVEEQFSGKWLELLTEAAPQVSRIAYLWNPANHSSASSWKAMQGLAPNLGLTLQSVELRDPKDLGDAFAAIIHNRADGVIVDSDAIMISNQARIVEFAAVNRLPTIYVFSYFVKSGGLMSYGPSLHGLWRRAATYVDKILKGRQPRRPAGGTADHVRAGRQSQDRAGARPDDPALASAARRRGDRMMRRAAFVAAIALGVGVGGAPLAAPAQQPEKVFRIGVLSSASRASTAGDAFRKRLHDLGYISGQNITIETRFAAGDFSRLPALAADLVRLPVDVIFTDAAQVAAEATRTIPIVSATLFDPVGAGLASSLAHPGGNVTGFTLFSEELSAKRLQLLKDALPAASHIAPLWNPASANIQSLRATEEAARTIGVQLLPIEIGTPNQIVARFETATAGGAEALVVIPDEMFWNHRERIVALAAKHRMPGIYPEREYADDGGLLAYGPNVPDNFRRAAEYVDKILKGDRPGDLPIQQPVKFELIVNLKTAAALRLTIPPLILARADEVIE